MKGVRNDQRERGSETTTLNSEQNPTHWTTHQTIHGSISGCFQISGRVARGSGWMWFGLFESIWKWAFLSVSSLTQRHQKHPTIYIEFSLFLPIWSRGFSKTDARSGWLKRLMRPSWTLPELSPQKKREILKKVAFIAWGLHLGSLSSRASCIQVTHLKVEYRGLVLVGCVVCVLCWLVWCVT